MSFDRPSDPSDPRVPFTGGSAAREPFTTPFGPDGGRPQLDTFRTAPDFGEPARTPGSPDRPQPGDPGQSSGGPDPVAQYQLECARLRNENEALRQRVAELEALVDQRPGLRPKE